MSGFIDSAVHESVLKNCVDVPQQKPSTQIWLTDVGISGKTVWVRLPQGTLPFTADLYVSLSAKRRGIHMSRIEEVISELHDGNFTSLKEYGVELAKRMIVRQEAPKANLSLTGKLPIIRKGIVSRRNSIDSIDISLDVVMESKDGGPITENIKLGVGVNHITACPCTQAYNEILFNKGNDPCPLPTHSQRSYTRVTIDVLDDRPTYEDLLDCLESSLHVTQDLLKRHDEAEIVLKSHNYPQFAEDAVRETAREVANRFMEIVPPTASIEIESLSLESIHIHDVHCRLITTMQEILQQLAMDDDAP